MSAHTHMARAGRTVRSRSSSAYSHFSRRQSLLCQSNSACHSMLAPVA